MSCDLPPEGLPEWMRFEWPVSQRLSDRLGDAGVRRLAQLMDEAGGLTPPEARHWFELDRSQWRTVTRIVVTGLWRRMNDGVLPPAHIQRWFEQFAQTDDETAWASPLRGRTWRA